MILPRNCLDYCVFFHGYRITYPNLTRSIKPNLIWICFGVKKILLDLISVLISMVDFGERRHHYASQIRIRSRPIFNFHQYSNRSGNIKSDLPTLVLQFTLFARQEAWRKSPVNQPS